MIPWASRLQNRNIGTDCPGNDGLGLFWSEAVQVHCYRYTPFCSHGGIAIGALVGGSLAFCQRLSGAICRS